MGRRHARLRIALFIGALVLALLPNFGTPAVASPRASGRIVASEVSRSHPARGAAGALSLPSGARISAADAGSTGGATLLYSSEVIDAGQVFDRLGIHWIAAPGAQDTIFVEARTSSDGALWSGWRQMNEEEDMTDELSNEHFAAPVPVAQTAARYAQYRVWLTSGDPDAIARVNLTFMDVSDLNAGPLARLLNDVAGAFSDFTRSYADAAPVGSSRILTRQDWAADENLMQWPPRYQKAQKFVIHHTVTDDGGNNVAATIRAIYYYHAVTRGWGDIGYNYLVDKFGNIWTGRQGGDNVIAGHAYGWNNGSIGIAALGDYSIAQPTSALQGAIANIVAIKATQLGIQPYGNDTFTHQEQAPDGSWVNITSNPPNVQGHRDCNYILSQHGGQTACPGNGIYNMIDGLRRLAQNAVNAGYFDMPYIDPQLPKAGFPGAVVSVPVTVTNRGQTAIPAGTNVSYRILSKGAVVQAQGPLAPIPAPLAPGQAATVNVAFSVPAIGSYIVRWDLQTGTQWWNTLKGTPVRDQWFNSADWSADWVKDNVPIAWVAGETKQITVTVQNDGGRVWPAGGANPVRLGYKWVSNATGNTFPGATRVALPADVQPGQSVTLTFPMTAPTYPTQYTNYLDLYKENEFAFSDKGVAPDDTPTGVSLDFKAAYQVQGQPTFSAGQTATVPVTVTNTGRGVFPTTSSYPVTLGYHWYTAAGVAAVWDGARTKLGADLAPGQSVTLQAQVTAPPQGGQYQLRFDLVQEGVAWFSSKGVATGTLSTPVAGPLVKTYGASYQPAVQTLAVSGSAASVPITVTNTSSFAWSAGGANPIHLSYHWSDSAGRTVVWDGLRTSLPADVAPGASASLQASLVFPTGTGTYTLRWDMVEEGVAWFSGKDVRTFDQPVQVGSTANLFYGGSLDVSATPATLPTAMPATFNVKVQNLSNFDWGASVNLSYHLYDASGNTVVWDGLRTSLAGMKVNELRTVAVKVGVPATAGTYTIRYDLVQEGVAWFSGNGMQTPQRTFTAVVPSYGATYVVAGNPISAPVAGTANVGVTLTNTGAMPWLRASQVNLAYHLSTAAGLLYVWDGARTALPTDVQPGQSIALVATVKAPATAGTYTLTFDLVQEGVTWFSGQGVPGGSATLQVQ
ncbi:MAG TPA: N-acetylmuramoyl-L-alanine amidase [Candidatus Limnocylindria bacterium]|nr:N-acetylmuramoyl-L-alanine amidase [Candidatus Limnocylindria bacterium]